MLTSSAVTYLFFSDKIVNNFDANYIDGCFSFCGDDKKICVTFDNSYNTVSIIFFKIVLVRISDTDIIVMNS